MNVRLVKQKDFFLLMLGKLVSLVGSNVQQFALSLYVLEVTGSATIFASILSICIFPRLLLSPIAGVFGDWFDRKKSIVILDFLNAIIIGIFALIYIVKGSISIPMVYILVVLLEITEIFFNSSMSAVMPSIVKEDELTDANSVNSVIMNMGGMLAPVIGALVYATFGMKIILIGNSISFLLSSISEMFINVPKNHKRPDKFDIKSFKTDLIEGIDIIKSNQLIRIMISLGAIINFCVSPLFGIGLIYIIKEIFKSSDIQFGIFQTVLATSMFIAPILCSGYIKKIKLGRLCYMSFTFISILVLIMAIVPSNLFMNIFNTNIIPYIAITIISFIIGIVVTVSNIALGTFFQKIVPLEAMGRTSTVFNLAVTISIPVGQMIFGLLYDTISASIVIIISGVIVLFTMLKYKNPLVSYDENSTGEEKGA